jgi:hypothetical protein
MVRDETTTLLLAAAMAAAFTLAVGTLPMRFGAASLVLGVGPEEMAGPAAQETALAAPYWGVP